MLLVVLERRRRCQKKKRKRDPPKAYPPYPPLPRKARACHPVTHPSDGANEKHDNRVTDRVIGDGVERVGPGDRYELSVDRLQVFDAKGKA